MFLKTFSQQKKRRTTNISGFTLIEVLVSMSLFTVVVTMSVGTLLVLIDSNAKQQGVQAVVTNMSFALDSMTREIRTGYFYYCGSASGALPSTVTNTVSDTRDCSGGNTALVITESGDSLTASAGSRRIAYRFNSAEHSIQRRLGTTGVWQNITAAEVSVESLLFVVTGTDRLPDIITPTVTIFVNGTMGTVDGLDTQFNMQTTVTQQVLDI